MSPSFVQLSKPPCRTAPDVVWLVLVMCLVGLMAVPGHADHIVVNNKSYTGSQLLSLKGGRVNYRTLDGQELDAWLSDVSLIIMDREGSFADFNQAERFFQNNQPEEAIGRYRRAQRLREDFWNDLIDARLLTAADRVGRLDESVQGLIRVLQSDAIGPAGAVRFMPANIPEIRNGEAARALEQLDAAILANPSEDQRIVLELTRFEVVRRTRPDRVDDCARKVALLPPSKELGTDRVWAIYVVAVELALRTQPNDDLLSAVAAASRHCPGGILGDMLLFKGRMLAGKAANREDLIRAAWPLMRVVIHYPNHRRVPESLFETALIMERLSRPDKSTELLRECLGHPQTSDKLRASAETALERVSSSKKKVG